MWQETAGQLIVVAGNDQKIGNGVSGFIWCCLYTDEFL